MRGRPGFNEAAASMPRMTPWLPADVGFSISSFNEAAASMPRMTCGRGRRTGGRCRCFNEAAASMPRMTPRARTTSPH